MALPLSPSVPVRFVPPEYDSGQTDAPVYLIAPPTLLERAAFGSACTAEGLRWPADSELRETLRAALELAAPANLGDHLADLDAAELVSPENPPAPELSARVARLEKWARDNVPDYAALIGARQRWNSAAPVIAAARFLRGWENVNVAFARKAGSVPLELLEMLPADHVAAIGNEGLRLMMVSDAQRKNSVSPPRSKASPPPSPAGQGQATAATDGSSSASVTGATPPST